MIAFLIYICLILKIFDKFSLDYQLVCCFFFAKWISDDIYADMILAHNFKHAKNIPVVRIDFALQILMLTVIEMLLRYNKFEQ